jgi:hypothetical protein
VEAEIVVDGRLDEEAWRGAAVLTGFSRYAPDDGVPADDSTEVLVWYSPAAIHFGIRAYAQPGTVNATLADRDRIYSDDYIGIFLATFDDGKQATVFAVNALGVQGDGILVERGVTSGGSFSGLQNGREPTDVAPDYVFDSKGRITDNGFEVEIRIPLKSLCAIRARRRRAGGSTYSVACRAAGSSTAGRRPSGRRRRTWRSSASYRGSRGWRGGGCWT